MPWVAVEHQSRQDTLPIPRAVFEEVKRLDLGCPSIGPFSSVATCGKACYSQDWNALILSSTGECRSLGRTVTRTVVTAAGHSPLQITGSDRGAAARGGRPPGPGRHHKVALGPVVAVGRLPRKGRDAGNGVAAADGIVVDHGVAAACVGRRGPAGCRSQPWRVTVLARQRGACCHCRQCVARVSSGCRRVGSSVATCSTEFRCARQEGPGGESHAIGQALRRPTCWTRRQRRSGRPTHGTQQGADGEDWGGHGRLNLRSTSRRLFPCPLTRAHAVQPRKALSQLLIGARRVSDSFACLMYRPSPFWFKRAPCLKRSRSPLSTSPSFPPLGLPAP